MTESTTRLHITPLTPDILPSILPPSLRESATDISYHSIPTFPENSYGYVTLPTMEADKVKRKFNGSILKGKKFKVDTARPQKRQRDEEDAGAEETAAGKKEKKKSKKRKSDEGVLDGFELPSDRKVKRGWTEPANAKKEKRKSEKKKGKGDKKEKPQPKSKYTEQSECLFRATVPPNRSSASDATQDKKAKKKKKSADDSVVHEFEKTVTYPSFLRSTDENGEPTAVFEEEKGWVDAAGNVKEAASEKVRKDNFRPGQVAGAKEKRPNKVSTPKEKTESPEPSGESDDWTSSSGSSSDESSDSDSESNSSDDASEQSTREKANGLAQLRGTTDHVNGDVAFSGDSDPEQASESSQKADESSKEVHPLEALFKRPASKAIDDQPAQDTTAGFSFFGNDIESDEEVPLNEPQTPFTPFTKRDLQARGLRSAAPTPDTAVINRRMTWADTNEMEEDVPFDTPVTKSRAVDDTAKEETEFAKWFWEHRGENNRAWKKRRRDAAKEQRQRENRKKGLKGKS